MFDDLGTLILQLEIMTLELGIWNLVFGTLNGKTRLL